jgi:hypothetical protein
VKKTEVEIWDSASTYITPHWGKFFCLQKVRKIYSTPHTGANFSIFEKLEKFILRYTLGQKFSIFRWKIGKIRRVIEPGLVKE